MKRNRGFTLIELMIVVAIIAVIAAIAIPQLLRSKMSSNEATAIGTLTTLRTVEAQFQQSLAVDQNADGVGEYGLLQELAGAQVPRGASVTRSSGEFISEELGAVNAQGMAYKAGYYYLMYVPTAAGTAKSAGAFTTWGAGGSVPADAPLQQVYWCCYAWPVSRGQSGNRAFVVNQSGMVYQTQNDGANQLYSGTGNVPPVQAAFVAIPGNQPITNVGGRLPKFTVGETGADGGIWTPAN